MTHTLPDSSHLSRIRNDLLNQDKFTAMLKTHEKEALDRYKRTGRTSFVKKYIHKTPTSMFDIHSFHDYWEVWIRTDILESRPLTSFLIRLGMIRDKNAETFFSNQCQSIICKKSLTSAVIVYNKMFDWGIFRPIRLNITESDETSGVSRHRLTLQEWNDSVAGMHRKGQGTAFSQ